MGLSCYAVYVYKSPQVARFNALMGLSCYVFTIPVMGGDCVSMPSWAWVVTARMSNILNFSWYFLCIPAIYRYILAHLPIFFNQLSKFLRCESPSTFLGTCLSHHSFIIFLVTNTNTLLSGLYFISTASMSNCQRQLYSCQCPLGLIPHFYAERWRELKREPVVVSMPSRAYTSFLQKVRRSRMHVSALVCQCPLGLELLQCSIQTTLKTMKFQCPLGLIPHFYGTPSKT